MKYLLKFISFVLFLSFVSCSPKSITNPIENNSGKIQLKVNRANAPTRVVTVSATLSRDGYDDITDTLNLLSNSTADIMLDNVHTGTWHLLVNAEDSAGVILYSGNSDVEILAGFITQVNLTLNPTGEGTGSIYIFVNWGTTTTNNWTDYSNNPILNYNSNSYNNYGVLTPKVLFINNQYKMWYLGLTNSAVSHVLYAESNDGIHWNFSEQSPVLYPGQPGSWDALAVQPGSIIYENGLYKMYYIGFANQYEQWNIGLAISPNGIHWEKYPEPVLYGSSGWEFQISVTTVIHHNETYYLYYTGRNLPEYKIGLATSTDGITFTKYSGNPILTKTNNTKNWEGLGVYYPSVIFENNQFKMVYANSLSSGFGFAYSPDGKNWTKQNNNPFYTNGDTANNWGAKKIAYPGYIKLSNEYRIYYSGISNNDQYFNIGFMRKPF